MESWIELGYQARVNGRAYYTDRRILVFIYLFFYQENMV